MYCTYFCTQLLEFVPIIPTNGVESSFTSSFDKLSHPIYKDMLSNLYSCKAVEDRNSWSGQHLLLYSSGSLMHYYSKLEAVQSVILFLSGKASRSYMFKFPSDNFSENF